MSKVFESPFEFCPECGSDFYFDEFIGKNMCAGCGKSAFKVAMNFRRFYGNFHPEFWEDDYNAGDI